MVKWDRICRSKKCGGLGVKNLQFIDITVISFLYKDIMVFHREIIVISFTEKYSHNLVKYSPIIFNSS